MRWVEGRVTGRIANGFGVKVARWRMWASFRSLRLYVRLESCGVSLFTPWARMTVTEVVDLERASFIGAKSSLETVLRLLCNCARLHVNRSTRAQ